VQLSEPEPLCVFDHQRVDRRHVDATFDNGRADQHVELAIPEIHHGALEHCFVHLTVGKRDARLGHQSPQIFRAFFKCVDAIVHPEHLAFTQQLSSNGFGCHPVVVRSHVSTNWLPVGRWRIE
jgi:hypothetical protein